ncbi:hypothetical protein C8R47DRAFT_1064360 [Mycena vitilis]|nr:hypothetical protein C8R47DRAFT_1064360 [Mycena vitilis]
MQDEDRLCGASAVPKFSSMKSQERSFSQTRTNVFLLPLSLTWQIPNRHSSGSWTSAPAPTAHSVNSNTHPRLPAPHRTAPPAPARYAAPSRIVQVILHRRLKLQPIEVRGCESRNVTAYSRTRPFTQSPRGLDSRALPSCVSHDVEGVVAEEGIPRVNGLLPVRVDGRALGESGNAPLAPRVGRRSGTCNGRSSVSVLRMPLSSTTHTHRHPLPSASKVALVARQPARASPLREILSSDEIPGLLPVEPTTRAQAHALPDCRRCGG